VINAVLAVAAALLAWRLVQVVRWPRQVARRPVRAVRDLALPVATHGVIAAGLLLVPSLLLEVSLRHALLRIPDLTAALIVSAVVLISTALARIGIALAAMRNSRPREERALPAAAPRPAG
jgi:hypothetical protein